MPRNQFFHRIQLQRRLIISRGKSLLQPRHRYQHWYRHQLLNRRHRNTKISLQVFLFSSRHKCSNKVCASSPTVHQHRMFAFYQVVKPFALPHLSRLQDKLDHRSARPFCDNSRLFSIQLHRRSYQLVNVCFHIFSCLFM